MPNGLPYFQETTLANPWGTYDRMHLAGEWSMGLALQRDRVSIIIPVWNALQYTKGCLTSLRAHSRFRREIIVVDNGSTDGTREYLAEQSDIQVITNQTNRGFAMACNQGAERATSPLVIFLNNDTLVTPSWDFLMVRPFLDNPSPLLVGPRGTGLSGPQNVPPHEAQYQSLADLAEFGTSWAKARWGDWEAVPRLTGFCLGTHRTAFLDLGGFDERFGMGNYEDDDLCHRYAAHGYPLLMLNDVFIHHFGSRTFVENKVNYVRLMEENRQKFESKWYPKRTHPNA